MSSQSIPDAIYKLTIRIIMLEKDTKKKLDVLEKKIEKLEKRTNSMPADSIDPLE